MPTEKLPTGNPAADVVTGCRVLGTDDHGDPVWGHVSRRDPQDRGVWLKTGGRGFDEVSGDDVALVDLDGNLLEGTGTPPKEFPLHTEVMRARTDVGAVVHCHPPYSIALAATGQPLHAFSNGAGPATRWASATAPGDTLEISGQARGGLRLRPDTSKVVLLGDHCALPAMATVLESLPSGVAAEAVIEVVGADDEIALARPAVSAVTWAVESGRPGARLVAAVQEMVFSDEPTEVWVGCEAGAMREIRRHLLANGARRAGTAPGGGVLTLHTRAYWKLNTANHSDHDTGEDD
ncbi:SIP domain-containing protein [Streptomyces sp. NPDC047061]|uniref:SIP domain-containing protein n=1 Tax=Streptomyces sp. NPDC047061 TaxID=3154605 RepID=UPI00340CD7C3